MDKPLLSRLTRVPLREAWMHEAGDFTPWLAERENIELLCDAIGIGDLDVLATEHWVGDFKLDILCTDGVDKVIIENQLERTNHTHLGQIITYAAGVGARKVIWLAETFRPEHIAALEFLNENTTEDLGFFALEVELYRIGDSPLAPKFEVKVRPNDWVRVGREQARAVEVASPTKQRQMQFWTELVAAVAREQPRVRAQMPRPRHWQQFTLGRSGVVISCTVNTREDRLGVELYIANQESKRMFRQLLESRDAIERSLGVAMDWQELPDARACRIAVYRLSSPLDADARWPEYFAWMVPMVLRMDATFRPLMRTL